MKHKEICLVLLGIIAVGLALPLGLVFLMARNLGVAPGVALIFMVCLGWPGYSVWMSLWACKDIRHRWFLPVLFPLMLSCPCGLLPGIFGPIGVFACGAMLVVSVVVMFATVSSKTKQ